MARPLDDTLISICIQKPPKRYLEIGTRDGGSLDAVLQHCNPQLIACCDTWGRVHGGTGRGNHNHIQEMLEDIGYDGEVIWLDGSSFDLIPQVKQTFDLILVDGDHSEYGATTDIRNSWRLLEPGGLMVVDDTVLITVVAFVCNKWAKRSDVEVVHNDMKEHGNIVFRRV
jgi:predicted O-methyltransferase YrrM